MTWKIQSAALIVCFGLTALVRGQTRPASQPQSASHSEATSKPLAPIEQAAQNLRLLGVSMVIYQNTHDNKVPTMDELVKDLDMEKSATLSPRTGKAFVLTGKPMSTRRDAKPEFVVAHEAGDAEMGLVLYNDMSISVLRGEAFKKATAKSDGK